MTSIIYSISLSLSSSSSFNSKNNTWNLYRSKKNSSNFQRWPQQMIRHFIQRYLTNVSFKQDSTFLLILQEYNTSTLRHDLPPNNSIRVETQICRCPSICKRNANDRHRFVATGKIAKGKVDRGALVGTNVGELCQNRELCQISRPSKPCNPAYPDHKQVVLSGMPEDLPWGLIIEPALRDLSSLFFPV